MKVSRSLKELSLKITRTTRNFTNEKDREPTVTELSELLTADPEDIIAALNSSQPALSLTMGDEDGDSQTDLPVDPPDEDITDKLALRQVLAELSDEDRKLIDLRYFKGLTQTKAAGILGMTQVQVSRREKKLLTYMRTKLI